ncbi:MAG: hypothetical protein ABIQ74_12060, partial [Chitinophagales bacterium]
APRGVTAILFSLQYFKTEEMASTEDGFKMISGGNFKSSVSSCEYLCNDSSSVKTEFSPRNSRKNCISDSFMEWKFITGSYKSNEVVSC